MRKQTPRMMDPHFLHPVPGYRKAKDFVQILCSFKIVSEELIKYWFLITILSKGNCCIRWRCGLLTFLFLAVILACLMLALPLLKKVSTKTLNQLVFLKEKSYRLYSTVCPAHQQRMEMKEANWEQIGWEELPSKFRQRFSVERRFMKVKVFVSRLTKERSAPARCTTGNVQRGKRKLQYITGGTVC